MRADASPCGQSPLVKAGTGKLNKGAGAPFRKSARVVGVFSPHERAQRRVNERRGLAGKPTADAHPPSRWRKYDFLPRGFVFLRRHAHGRVFPQGARFETSLEFARGKLTRPLNYLFLNPLAAKRLPQGGRGKHPPNAVDMLGEHVPRLQRGGHDRQLLA